jgi:uncharacterized membrane protein (DUF373 family)
MDINQICFISFFILVLAMIIAMNNIYNKNGDIKTLTHDFSFNKVNNEFNNKDKILSRIHNLFIYKNNYVYWIYYLVISIISALLLNLIFAEIYKVKISFVAVLSTILLLFIILELPRRFINSHFEKVAEIEGVTLLNMLKERYL